MVRKSEFQMIQNQATGPRQNYPIENIEQRDIQTSFNEVRRVLTALMPYRPCVRNK